MTGWDAWERQNEHMEIGPEYETEQIDDIPEWDGDETLCPCCGGWKQEESDECPPCLRAGRLRDFDRHPSADADE